MIKLDTGDVFGDLEVIEEDNEVTKQRNDNSRYYKCKCKCGSIVSAAAHRINAGLVKSCGCAIFKRGKNEIVSVQDTFIELKASNCNAVFRVSKEAYDVVKEFHWLITINGSVRSTVSGYGEIRLTKLLSNKLDCEDRVNFKNRNTLDLTYENLVSTSKRNNADTRNTYCNTRKKTKQWHAYSTDIGGRRYLGCFSTKEEAILARDIAENSIKFPIYTKLDTEKAYKQIMDILGTRNIEKKYGPRESEISREDSIGCLLDNTETYVKWDKSTNKLDPYKLAVKSSKKAHWICQAEHKLCRTVNYMNSIGFDCHYCHFSSNSKRSLKEIYLFELFETSFDNVIKSYKRNVNGKELDMLIYDLGVAIEYNGMYWHKDDSEEYRLSKSQMAEELGLRLYFIHAYNTKTDFKIIENERYTIIEVGIMSNYDLDVLFENLMAFM